MAEAQPAPVDRYAFVPDSTKINWHRVKTQMIMEWVQGTDKEENLITEKQADEIGDEIGALEGTMPKEKLDQLTVQKIIEKAAKNLGIRVDVEDVIERISRIFIESGKSLQNDAAVIETIAAFLRIRKRFGETLSDWPKAEAKAA
ncbi:MAG: hypothetical protein V1760_03095 [Candidatus Peregrinibacteria bacterium]